MPRTWSYRKRDYQLTKPQVKGMSPQIIGLIIVYLVMGTAITIGMSIAFAHKINQTTPVTVVPPGHQSHPLDD